MRPAIVRARLRDTRPHQCAFTRPTDPSRHAAPHSTLHGAGENCFGRRSSVVGRRGWRVSTHPSWRKSTASGDTPNCVEVAELSDGSMLVRDSKDPDGPHLHFTGNEWDAFLDGAVAGEFRRSSRQV